MYSKSKSMLFLLIMILLGCGPQKSSDKGVSSKPLEDTATYNAREIIETERQEIPDKPTEVEVLDSMDKVSSKGKETSVPSQDNPKPKTSKPVAKKDVPDENKIKSKESKVKDPVAEITPPDQVAPPANAVVEVGHEKWNQLLQKYVSPAGKVDYEGLKTAEGKLDEYLEELSKYPLQGTESRNFTMSYWINAYNAFTVKLILDHYPVKSIMSIKGGKAWDHKWIELAGKTYSLNQIEHQILRKDYPDARIHFAVNCAAISCPPLLNKAWTENNLEANLEKQTRSYINDATHNQIAPDQIRLSKIFEWYKDDFGDLVQYVNKYTETSIEANAKVKFNEYDWGLNGR